MPSSVDRDDVSFLSLVLPLLERWRVVLTVVLVAVALTVGLSLTSNRRYEAVTTMSTIASGRAIPADISSFLGTTNSGGLQPTPALIVLLSHQPGVLYRVGMRRTGAQDSSRIIDRIAALGGHPIGDRDVARAIGNMVESASDKETGVITLRVTSSDSALARLLAQAMVTEISTTFVGAAKAQATAMRNALITRVDSAQRQLARADEEQRRFLAANRTVNQFAEAAVTEQRLSRAVDLAQAVYSQAVKDREAAVSKELEDTPAVVVIDPPAHTLEPVSRQSVIKGIVVGAFTLFAAWIVLLIRSRMAAGGEDAVDERTRLRVALRSIPGLGALMIRLFGLRDAGGVAPAGHEPASTDGASRARIESYR